MAYASGVRIRDREPKTSPLELILSPPPAARYTTHVPVYDLTAAAGFWGPESVPEEIGWTEVPGVSLKPGMFVARVTGKSMEPLIPDGSWCLFRPCPAGSGEGRIVLVQLGTDGAGENGGRFTVKKYHSELSTDLAVTTDGWRHDRIQLLPVNPAFEPIEIEAEVAADIVIVGEFAVLIPQSGRRYPSLLCVSHNTDTTRRSAVRGRFRPRGPDDIIVRYRGDEIIGLTIRHASRVRTAQPPRGRRHDAATACRGSGRRASQPDRLFGFVTAGAVPSDAAPAFFFHDRFHGESHGSSCHCFSQAFRGGMPTGSPRRGCRPRP